MTDRFHYGNNKQKNFEINKSRIFRDLDPPVINTENPTPGT